MSDDLQNPYPHTWIPTSEQRAQDAAKIEYLAQVMAQAVANALGTESSSALAAAAWELAQIGTNTGTAAYNLAQQAYNLAVIASGSTAADVALAAYVLAQIGTNTGSTAYSVAQSAWALAQIGTNTGTAAYNLATSGSNLAWQSYLIAQNGTSTATAAYDLATMALSTAQSAFSIAVVGTNVGSTAYSVASAAYALAQLGTVYATGSTFGQIRTAGDLVGPAQAPVVASAGSAFAFLGSYSPSRIANQVDDYSPTYLPITSILRLNPDPIFPPTLTGLAGGTSGRIIFVYNTSATASIGFTANSTDSSSLNRFAFPNNVSLLPGRGFFIIYDNVLSKWLLFNPCVWLAGDLGGTENIPYVTGATQSFSFKGQLNPTAISADQNNYAPGNNATIYELSSTQAVNITGLSIGNANGQLAFLYNNGTFPITLVNESASSNPSNRFKLGIDWVLNPGSTLAIWHNASTARWQVFGFDPQYLFSLASAAYAIAQIGTNTGSAAYSTAQAAYALAQFGTNSGSTAYSVAQSAWALAQIGTNTGSTAYSVAQSAFALAQIGSNTGSTAYSVASAAYVLAQIGTNTGSTAYSVAQSAFSIAVSGSTTANTALAEADVAVVSISTGTALNWMMTMMLMGA